MRKVIAILIASNIAFAALAGWFFYLDRQPTYADHVRGFDMDIKDGQLKVKLGQSSNAGGPVPNDAHDSKVLVLTPRAAIQLQTGIGQIINLTKSEAARRQGSAL